ncbi:MAG: TraB/GumN family protein [Polyangiales bacterium]
MRAHSDRPTPIFHRVTSDTATVYLLGSIHVGKKALYPLPRAIESAFEKSDSLVVEVRLDPMATLKTAKILADARYPSGDSLRNHVDGKTWSLLAKDPPMPLGMLERMQPWTVSLTVLAVDLKRAGFEPDAGIDKHFMDEADQRSKPVIGIETVEDQLALLSGLPEDQQATMLREALEEGAKVGEQIDGLATAWAHGDEITLEKKLREDWQKPEYQTLFKKMFTDRNDKMTAAIDGYLKEKGTRFVVVGAAHVVGEGGIVDLLKKRGRKVERVRIN